MGNSMSIVLNSSGGGSVTINEPSTASNFTQTLPAATGTILTTGSTGVCQAWVNFNGTGTVAIRASYNVSSITDNGTGDYTLNFATALVDTNYAPIISSNNNASNISVSNNNDYASERLTGSYRFAHVEAASLTDGSVMCVAIFR